MQLIHEVAGSVGLRVEFDRAVEQSFSSGIAGIHSEDASAEILLAGLADLCEARCERYRGTLKIVSAQSHNIQRRRLSNALDENRRYDDDRNDEVRDWLIDQRSLMDPVLWRGTAFAFWFPGTGGNRGASSLRLSDATRFDAQKRMANEYGVDGNRIWGFVESVLVMTWE